MPSQRTLIAALLTIVLASSARADDVNAAREHYRRGTALFDIGRYNEAALEYEKAFQQKDDPALLFNIAQAYRLAAKYPEAVRAYKGYLRRVPDAPNRPEVQARVQELEGIIQRQQSAQQNPPEGTMRPSAETTTSAQPAPVDQAPAAPKPIYKKWWFWTAIGAVVVVGVGLGVGLGLGLQDDPSLGTFGPGALTVRWP